MAELIADSDANRCYLDDGRLAALAHKVVDGLCLGESAGATASERALRLFFY